MEEGYCMTFYDNGSVSFDGIHLFILITFMVLLIHIKMLCVSYVNY